VFFTEKKSILMKIKKNLKTPNVFLSNRSKKEAKFLFEGVSNFSVLFQKK
jgi:hypothetical protein